LVEERRAGVLVALLGLFVRQHSLDLRRIERVEGRVTLFALVRVLSRPLRMLLASRPGAVALDRRELELLVFGREHPRGAVGWVIGGTTAHRLIDHVDDIALFDKKLGPALRDRRVFPSSWSPFAPRRGSGRADKAVALPSAPELRRRSDPA